MTGFIFVGLGGAAGAMLRYGISLIPFKHTFPFPTLVINLIGALLIGYITGLAVKRVLSQNTVLFLKTGLCGGFTTFSTFSLEAYELMKAGSYGQSVLYVILSVVGCVIGVACGMAISKI